MLSNTAHFGIFPIKKSTHTAFLSNLDIINVTVDCWGGSLQFKSYSRSFDHTCVLPRGCGVWGSHIRRAVRCGYQHVPHLIIM